MRIIPAINEVDFSKIKEKLLKAVEFFSDLPAEALAEEGWVQIDIADGKFTKHKTWDNPSDLITNYQLPITNLEIHLMVKNPQDVIGGWIKVGAKRIIIHYEAIVDSTKINPDNDESGILNFILEKCKNNGIKLGLAINPETPAEKLIPYLDKINFIQLLAVEPGLAGQKFQEEIVKKIGFFKNQKNFGGRVNDIIIEIDGGINLKTAELCKKAGADILVAASYIWNGKNPKASFDELSGI